MDNYNNYQANTYETLIIINTPIKTQPVMVSLVVDVLGY
jgi:hypothetical protein